MGVIAKAIPTIAYNAGLSVASFRYKNWRVILNKKEIFIKDVDKTEDAVEVMEYLKKLTETDQQT